MRGIKRRLNSNHQFWNGKIQGKARTHKCECYATNEKWWEPDNEDRNYGRIYGDFASEVFHDEKPAVLDHGI
jgi:hypothetical protein